MTRKFDRPTEGNMAKSYQIVRYFDRFLTSLETSLTDITNNVAAIAAAQAAATSAQSTANTAKTNDKISSSWTSPGSILTASDAGTDATISVINHTRKYGDQTSVAVTGSSINGQAYSTTYFVYYDDPTTAGGAVTFHATTDPNVAAYNAASGRHNCGSVTTPASGGGSTSGGVTPPGGNYTGPGEIP